MREGGREREGEREIGRNGGKEGAKKREKECHYYDRGIIAAPFAGSLRLCTHVATPATFMVLTRTSPVSSTQYLLRSISASYCKLKS